MRPKRLVYLVIALIFLLSGCAETASLYALPRNEALEASYQLPELQGHTLLTVSDGKSLLQEDLDGDGEEETIAFFGDGNGSVKLSVLSAAAQLTFDCSGTEIHSVTLEDITGDGNKELLVLSGLPGVSARVLQVFGCKDGGIEALISEPCRLLELHDLNGDGVREVYCIGDDGTKCTVKACLSSGGVLTQSDPLPMWFSYENLTSISTGQLSDGTEVLLLTGVLEDGNLYTEPIRTLQNNVESLAGAPHEPRPGLFQVPIRSNFVYPQDIDGDGDTDFPVSRELPRYDAGSTPQSVVDWYDFALDGAQGVSTVTYHNFSGGWYLKFPETWWENITIRETDLTTTLSTVTIYRLTEKGAEEFLTVYEVQGEDQQNFVEEENLTILRSDTERTLALGLSRKAQRLDETVTTASIAERFFVLDDEQDISGNAE